MPTPTLYGIKTCTTCRRAWQWLDNANVEYRWVDLRADGVEKKRLTQWRERLGADRLLNKRSKVWRDFDADQRASAESNPVTILVEQPTLIKRPILETENTENEVIAGFSEAQYQSALGHNG